MCPHILPLGTTMTQRVDNMQRSLELSKRFTNRIRERIIEAPIRDLVLIRASQINGCDFGVDPHFEPARIRRERELRVIVAATALALGAFVGAPAIAAPAQPIASSTKPAKFVVFLVKNQGAPALIPVH